MRVVLEASQEVFDLTPEQVRILKSQLTYDNPGYANAKRFGKAQRMTRIPPYLTYYKECSREIDGVTRPYLSIPSGVDLRRVFNLPELDAYEAAWSDVKAEFPRFALTPRPVQVEAARAYISCQDDIYPASLVQMPTAKGKTIMSLYLASLLGRKTLVLVHKDDLVDGWRKDIIKSFPDMKDIGLIKAQSRKIGSCITIATVQTLSRMNPDEFNALTRQFGFVIQDECHHIGLNIFNVIGSFAARYKLGLSATPVRSDGLNFVFDLFLGGLCYAYQIPADTEDEDVLPVDVRVVQAPAPYRPFLLEGQVLNYYSYVRSVPESMRPKGYRFLDEIPYARRPNVSRFLPDDEVVSDASTKDIVLSLVRDEAVEQGHNVLLMFSQKSHVDAYYEFLESSLPALEGKIQKYYGDNDKPDSYYKEAAESGEKTVTLATYSKTSEGTNVKAWEVLILVSDIKNEVSVQQSVGRVRRSKEGKLNPVRVYDLHYVNCQAFSGHLFDRLNIYRQMGFRVSGVEEIPRPVTRRSLFQRRRN